MVDETTPISLGGSALGGARHVCAFFNDDDEEYRVLLPFIREGFECGDKAIHVVNPDQRGSHLRRLGAAGIDAEVAEQRGQFDLRDSTEIYLREGRFDQDRMLGVFEELAGSAAGQGFRRSRIVCRMDWAAQNQAFVDTVIEFEARVNDIWRRHDDVVICTYHPGRFSGGTVIDIMRTHPMVIVGGVLHRNPFFVPPERFLEAFRERKDKPAPRSGPTT